MSQENGTINFQELRAFASVARHLGVTPAAQALRLPKSTVSLQLTRLEERLGLRLFQRNSRKVALTREGEQLLPRVQSILAEAEQLFDETARAKASPSGTVRIAVPPALGELVLDQLVPAVTERYPGISLVIQPSYDIDDVQDPSFDFAIRAGQVGDEGLVADVIGKFSRVLVASPNLAPIPTQIQDLSHVPLFAFSGTSTHIGWVLCDPSGVERGVTLDLQARASIRDFGALIRLVRSGHGITMVPEFMVRDELAAGRLVHVLPSWRPLPVDVLLAYRVGAARISRVAAVLEEARCAVRSVLV